MYWFSISHHVATVVGGFFVCLFGVFCLIVSTLPDFLSCGTMATAPVVVEFRWDGMGILRSRNAKNPKVAALHQISHSLLSLLL